MGGEHVSAPLPMLGATHPMRNKDNERGPICGNIAIHRGR
jgi:hypothetical protein